MKFLNSLLMSLCVLGLISCDVGNNSNTESIKGDGSMAETIELSLFEKSKQIRLSSYSSGSENSNVHYLKQIAPYDDSYKFKTNEYTSCEIYDKDGKLIAEVPAKTRKSIELSKDDIVYVVATSEPGQTIEYEVELKEHNALLPYDPINIVDGAKMLEIDKSGYDPLVAATVNFVKREGGMYINCNNPEKLKDSSLNKALTRNDVSNKEVFFTFEHNNAVTGSFHYGYQVINKGTEDVYITVKNIGFQLDGAGCWLGEKEWTDFYNTSFRMKGFDDYTESQLSTLSAYYDFCNTYEAPNYQPMTYRLPAGKHIYVMGGTTEDAYNNVNVFNTADKKVNGGCSNGAVLFEVIGDNVEAAFYAYKKSENVQIDNNTHQGYVTVDDKGNAYGRQYVGYDNCHGVVDANLTWEFSDHTPSQLLPVTYINYYDEDVKESGNTPYGKINSTPHENDRTNWVTHINPQNSHAGVGTDMTKYYTVDENGNPICIDSDHFDGLGHTANIGNWMIDYMENYTLVNHGNNERKVILSFTNTGSVAVLVRDENGKYIEGTAQYTIYTNATGYGSPIHDKFEYVVVVPAHSVVQLTVEYNLLANSNGYISHTAELI